MLLSVIIPLYNKEDSIAATIESVLTQDFSDYEIVVVDDGSTDGSLDVVRSIKNGKISIYQKENGGPSSARNFGVQKAQGEWVLLLDADDRLTPGALRLIQYYIIRKRRVDIFTFNFYIDFEGHMSLFLPSHANGRVHQPFFSLYLNKIFPRTGNTVCKREVFIKEPFEERFRRYEDVENNYRLMGKYRFYACSQPVLVYNRNTIAASQKRENVKEDFCCSMQPKGKPIIQQLLMYRLFKEDTSINYPELASELYQEFDIKRIERWGRRILRYKQTKRQIRSVLRRIHLLS